MNGVKIEEAKLEAQMSRDWIRICQLDGPQTGKFQIQLVMKLTFTMVES